MPMPMKPKCAIEVYETRRLRSFWPTASRAAYRMPITPSAIAAGSIAEKALLDALFSGQAHLHDTIERHMGDPLPMIGGGQPVSEAVALLENADAAMVLIDGKPAGVLTRQDLLAHIG